MQSTKRLSQYYLEQNLQPQLSRCLLKVGPFYSIIWFPPDLLHQYKTHEEEDGGVEVFWDPKNP